MHSANQLKKGCIFFHSEGIVDFSIKHEDKSYCLSRSNSNGDYSATFYAPTIKGIKAIYKKQKWLAFCYSKQIENTVESYEAGPEGASYKASYFTTEGLVAGNGLSKYCVELKANRLSHKQTFFCATLGEAESRFAHHCFTIDMWVKRQKRIDEGKEKPYLSPFRKQA